jgi:hypothetical protein
MIKPLASPAKGGDPPFLFLSRVTVKSCKDKNLHAEKSSVGVIARCAHGPVPSPALSGSGSRSKDDQGFGKCHLSSA